MSWLREANTEPIPGYRLIEPLGSGGFGEVWKCEAPGGLFKAIKFVYGNLDSLDVDGVRAEQEWKALQRIKDVRHPFVCSVERIDKVEGELVIVMELAERTLHDLYQECQGAGLIGISGDDLLRYLRDAAEALDFMNERHTLQHLDVKPRNLFLIGDRVKVADFGLVKHLERSTNSGLLGGVTPLYASPETFTGKLSPHSDQYSLAIVYQEMLTGHRPFQAKNLRQLAQMHMQGEPDMRSLPEAERPIVARALAKDPARRFASCMAFVSALYKARSAARAAEVGALARGRKTLAETLEDAFLDDGRAASQSSAELDLTRPPQKAPGSSPEMEVSGMGVTIMQPDHGALRPTLIVGVGSFGRKALVELRCRFLDRFGDLGKLPLLRFLYLDPDPEASDSCLRGAPEVALTRGEFHPLPLQPVGNYRRRSLDHLSEWLPREKLYAMPRSLQTQGSRALGRLAFADNQQRVLARLRRDLQEITKPDNVFQAVSKTSLALCNSTPRVYVLAAAGGGASGLLPDLGYALRRLLANLRHPDATVTMLLMCGAPQDPVTPKGEQANVYATLTELNHYSDPAIPFTAQYGPDGQRLVDEGAPFSSVYLLPLAHRTPDALDETVAHLGSYLFHEITTPLGLRLDELRRADHLAESGPRVVAQSLRSFGTYAVWFPRGLLLNLAARQACMRLIEEWIAADNGPLSAEMQLAVQQVVKSYGDHADLTAEALAKRIEQLTHAGSPTEPGDTPGVVLTGVLAKLEEQLVQSVAQDDPGNWAKQALGRVRDWVGGGGEGEQELNEWRKTRLARLLQTTALKLAEQWEQTITSETFALMQNPGARVATAELALARIQQALAKAAEAQRHPLAQQADRIAQAWQHVEQALQECITGGGFRWFGGRSRTRQLRIFMDHLSDFVHLRLDEELRGAARFCLINLAGRLAERSRDLGFCRQRLRHMQQSLQNGPADPAEEMATLRPGAEHPLTRSPLPSANTYWEAIRQSATARVLLPDGQDDLEQAALRYLQGLHSDHWEQLDRELYENVLLPQGGLHGACISGDLTRQLAVPLLEAASKALDQHLPIMDVAQILKSEADAAGSDNLREHTGDYLDRAVPLLAGRDGSRQVNYLLVPASPAGKTLGEAVVTLYPDIRLVRVPGQSDLMFLREQGGLGAADFEPLLRLCRTAYEATVNSPNTSPHARFDILDWLPIDP